MTNRYYVPAKILETALAAITVPQAKARYFEPKNPETWLRIDLNTGLCAIGSRCFFAEIYCDFLNKGDRVVGGGIYYLSQESLENCLDPENLINGRTISDSDLEDARQTEVMEGNYSYLKEACANRIAQEAEEGPYDAPSAYFYDMETIESLQGFLSAFEHGQERKDTANTRLSDAIFLRPISNDWRGFAVVKFATPGNEYNFY